jgi:putative transposase
MVEDKGLSVSRACKAAPLSRAAYYRQSIDWVKRDGPIVDALNAVVEKRHRWGFWKCYDRLRLNGQAWNHKRVHRVYCAMKLNLPRRTKHRLPLRPVQTLVVPAAVNAVWALDFMSDSLYDGRRFRTLNVLDEGVREALAIEVDTSLPARRVVRVLDRLVQFRGAPLALRMDNGPELIAQELVEWCAAQGIQMRHIQPGKPNQNAYIERFNRSVREEVLNAYVFENLTQVRELTTAWMKSYNEDRPHDALGSLPPAVFRARIEARQIPTSELST